MGGYLPPLATPADPALDELVTRLGELGYLDTAATVAIGNVNDPQFQDAVSRFQQQRGLPTSGDIDRSTTELLFAPRFCAMPDLAMEAASSCKWPMKDVTYSHRLSFPGVDQAVIDLAFREACDGWNAVCGIRLTWTDDYNRANIYADDGQIDGRSGTLAYSYLPCGATATDRMQQVYDFAESWPVAFLRQVIQHEVGHAIGISHGPTGSVMQPYANSAITKPMEWDIAEAQSRYGKATVPVPPTPGPTPPPTDIAITGTIFVNGRPYILVPQVDLGGF